jgi:hypothetical protein
MSITKNWKLIFGIIMIILSIVFYYIHYVLFHDSHHIFIYLLFGQQKLKFGQQMGNENKQKTEIGQQNYGN